MYFHPVGMVCFKYQNNSLIKEKTLCYDLVMEPDAPFAHYPLSAQTQRGLRRYLPDNDAISPTPIQRATLQIG
jgi:hypothetical protein